MMVRPLAFGLRRRWGRFRRRLGGTCLLITLAGGLAPSGAHGQENLPVLTRVGPWPVVSRLIGYGERVWFANSVKGVNHNSADLYSYDPASDDVRHERHLFSQDAGRPLVADGLLYWPFEDARVSAGVGHFMVTDGRAWRLGTIATARTFHTHAMGATDRTLVAATSAWRAGLQVSVDRGATWRQAYDHPTPKGQVTRIVQLVALEDRVFGYLVGRDQRRLLRFDRRTVTEVPGWPQDRPIAGLARHGKHVYGLVRAGAGIAVWRTDGIESKQVAAPRTGWPAQSLAAGNGDLFAITASVGDGALWQSVDGRDWQRTHLLAGGRPYELVVHAGNVYVGGAGDDGRGILWGTRRPVAPEAQAPGPLLDPRSRQEAARDWHAEGQELERMLADPGSYRQHGARLRAAILDLALDDPPAGFFSNRLRRAMPSDELALIGGAVHAPAARLGRWLLLWGMSLAGEGDVPVVLIAQRWTAPANRAEKYFDAPPAAMWTAALIGQDGRATIDALVGRLERTGDPLWLRGDAVGALTALTGERFAYDLDAWRAWWGENRAGWPE